MSETWQIAVVGMMIGVIQLLLAGILSWLAVELRRLNHELSYRVHNKECDRRMIEYERRLTELEKNNRKVFP